MDVVELRRLLTPLVGMAGREHMRSVQSPRHVSLRYDHVTDWDAVGVLIEKHDLYLFDGQELFSLSITSENE